MPGGYGGFDLYSAELLEDGYGPAINLGPLVNGGSNEVFPFIHDDALYFSSDRPESLGGLDIYAVNMDLKSGLRNMGVPYNSVQDDFAYFVDGAGLKYISSDRGKTESRDDIFSIVYLRDRYNLRVLSEKGEFLNDSKDLQLKILDADGKDVAININDAKGSELESGNYTVDIRKKGYFPVKIPLKVKNEGAKYRELTYNLTPIPYQRSITIDTIYYNLDKHDIRPDAAISLDLAVDILNEFPDFNLKITSHTDSRASKGYNERLSKKRSLSASKYLKNKGIDNKRMKLDWRGKLELVNPCGDGVKCPEELHQKNRRSILNLEIYPNSDQDFELPGGLNHLSTTEELMNFFKNKIKSKRDSLFRLLNPNAISNLAEPSQTQANQESPVIQYLADNVVLVSVSGSFYLVYESWTTEAMALKRAKELVKEINSTIYFIPSKQENENYRLAVAKYNTYEEVNKVIRKMRKKYKNEDIWMLDYR
jgi:outer membrane protein OmpA-like peptidoglycan-associated protein